MHRQDNGFVDGISIGNVRKYNNEVRLMRENIMTKRGLVSLLTICTYPVLFMYLKNVGEASIADVVPIWLLFVAVASVVLIIQSCIMKSVEKGCALASITMLFLLNYEIFVGGGTQQKYILVSSLLVFVLIICAILLKKNEELAENVNLIFSIVFSILIILNIFPAIPTIIDKITISVEKPDILESIEKESLVLKEKPNIYYMIFDEYGGPENLDVFFAYNNTEFNEFLSERKFSQSLSSYNEKTSTTIVVPNLMNIDYVVDSDMIEEERLAYMEQPILFEIMQYLGYDIYTCSHVPFLDNSMSVQSFEEQENFEDTAGYYILKNSVFIHVYNRVINYIDSDEIEVATYGGRLIESFEYYRQIAAEKKYKSKFCVGYFQAPHVPFFYRIDGSVNKQIDRRDWKNKSNYLEYLEWTNNQIKETVETIIANDPEAIIIIQSDHGVRYVSHMAKESELIFTEAEKEVQLNILNCVYYKGQEIDIEGLSGINTLRYILNKQFKLGLEMI